MSRRHRDEHDNHERWLVSYADFITLLFAFFVVMYSISSVNDGKYRVLSESLLQAFQATERSLDPIQIGELKRNAALQSGDVFDAKRGQDTITRPGSRPEAEEVDPLQPEASQTPQSFRQLQDELSESLQALIKADLVKIRANQDWLEIDMRSGILFASGRAELNPRAKVLLADIGRILSKTKNLIRVRGFTDNKPIATRDFPSNWHLSTARATEVVNMLQKLGIVPARMGIEGFGEYQPVASNETDDGRAKNRRVVIAVARGVLETDAQGGVIPPSPAGRSEPEPELFIERLPDGSWQPAKNPSPPAGNGGQG
ncbi:MAG: flagellar motor protein MotD [Gammaproteobacteria bacterium]|nr:flagellar motor protein MotD [Gammaproteobacteria bacterium]